MTKIVWSPEHKDGSKRHKFPDDEYPGLQTSEAYARESCALSKTMCIGDLRA